MGTTLKFDSSRNSSNDVKQITISCRATIEMDADLIKAASDLNLKNKSELLHDICADFLNQHFRRCRPLTRMEKAARTREIAQELRDLWCDQPGPAMVADRRIS